MFTSHTYRARFRGYRNFGFTATLVAVGLCYLATLLDSMWFAVAASPPLLLGLTSLLGYYVTGFSE